MENSTIPLMIRFKRHASQSEPDFTYDERAQLNVSKLGEGLHPTVLLPNSLALMKSSPADGGED